MKKHIDEIHEINSQMEGHGTKKVVEEDEKEWKCIIEHNGNNQVVLFECCYCRERYDYNNDVKKHINERHKSLSLKYSEILDTKGNTIYKCNQCIFKSPKPGGMKRHITVIHKPKTENTVGKKMMII